jgi:hypothetical protein
MKDIRTFALEKYSSDNYREAAFGVYYNKESDNYCFCFEADEMDQYPLEDLLEQYNLSETDDCGVVIGKDGKSNYIAEVETVSSDKSDFIQLMNFTTIVGREVLDFEIGDYVYLGVKYADSNFSINGIRVNAPIIGYRTDSSGMTSFDVIYPDIQYKEMFTSGNNFSAKLSTADIENINLIIIKDGHAKLFSTYEEISRMIIFNTDGFITVENTSGI